MSEKTKLGLDGPFNGEDAAGNPQSGEDNERGDGPLTRRFTYSQWPSRDENPDAGLDTLTVPRDQIILRLESILDGLKPQEGTQGNADEYQAVISQLRSNSGPLEPDGKVAESEE